MPLSTKGSWPTTWRSATQKVQFCWKKLVKETNAPLAERLSITTGAWKCTWRRRTGSRQCPARSAASCSRASWPWVTTWRTSTTRARGIVVPNQAARSLCRTRLISRFQLKIIWFVTIVVKYYWHSFWNIIDILFEGPHSSRPPRSIKVDLKFSFPKKFERKCHQIYRERSELNCRKNWQAFY